MYQGKKEQGRGLFNKLGIDENILHLQTAANKGGGGGG